ncbi:rRNA maturation RNase YbeY [bacterium]|nr:rRNA maturation RNase YbeY [bacterium]MBU1957584.1 rRNA maturation RNase YbeY [bacterium]
MLNIENLTNLTVNAVPLEDIAKELTSREIDLTICNNETIQEYNKEYRGKDTPTDVLSFPIESDMEIMPLGSIVISADYVLQKATELGHRQEDELMLLFIHGLLHLLGYDHEVDNGEMRKKEESIIHTLNLPKSLIVRTEES